MNKQKKLVVFTGAGMSADSGLSTFRDSDGLWDKYRIEDVCTPEALIRNRETVIRFYNIRRKELLTVDPNAGQPCTGPSGTIFRHGDHHTEHR